MEKSLGIDFFILIAAAIGFILYGYFGRRVKGGSAEEKLGLFRIAAGLSMSFIGGAATIAMSGIGYANGWIALVDPIAVVFGGGFVVLLVSLFSVPDSNQGASAYLAGGNKVRTLVYATCGIFVYLLLAGAQIVALQKIFTPYLGAQPALLVAVTLFSAILGYIYKGGIGAVTKTDVLQFIIVVFLFVLPAIYGISTITSNVSLNPSIPQVPLDLRTVLMLSLSLLFVPLSQDVWYRIRRSESVTTARLGVMAGVIIYAAIVTIAISLGVFSAYAGIDVSDPESILTFFFTSELGVAGFVTAVIILAAVMSTLDSFSFNLISTLSEDLFGNKPQSSRYKYRRIAATFTVFFGCLVIVFFASSVLSLVLTALMIYVTVIGPGLVLNKVVKKDSILWVPALLILALILSFGLAGVRIPYEPYSYLLIHLSLIAAAFLITKLGAYIANNRQ
ncbi:MAG: hypothetical protein AB2598_20935 [Candidatus Thiodiazotropha sp.]